MRIQALVVESQGRRIVVDTCLGNDKTRNNPFFADLHTTFLDDLTAAGFAPETIDAVVCTHLHVDHIGWNTMLRDGEWVPTFPNARYYLSRRDVEYWSSTPSIDGDLYGDSVRPVLDAGQADLVDAPYAITGEVSLEPTPGHSPGHVSVRIRSGGHEAVITGDVMHHPAQCARPAWASTFDADAPHAAGHAARLPRRPRRPQRPRDRYPLRRTGRRLHHQRRRHVSIRLGLFRLGSEDAADDVVRDLVNLAAGVHRVLLQEAPRIRLAEPVLVHQPALGAVDDLARLEPFGEIGVLLFERDDLFEAPERGDDRGQEVARLERLDEIRERARVACLLDEIVLRERGEDEHRREPLARDRARRGEPVHARHLDVEDREVGLELAHELDRVVAATGFTDDLVALFLEDLLEVQSG